MNGKLDVEVRDGKVIAVWLGCKLLPFEQWDIDEPRWADLGRPSDGRRFNPEGRIVGKPVVEYTNRILDEPVPEPESDADA